MPKDTQDKTLEENVGEMSTFLQEFGSAFEEFKATNDDRIKQLEKNGSADPVTEDKQDKIDQVLTKFDDMQSRMETFMNRPATGGGEGGEGGAGGEGTPEEFQTQYNEAFTAYLRTGDEDALRPIREQYATQVGVLADGGYAVPEILDRDMIELRREVSSIYRLANVQMVASPDVRKLVNLQGGDFGWVGETDPRPVTNTPTMGEVTPIWGEAYAYPHSTQQALEDPFFDVEAWIEREIEYVMTEGMNNAHWIGDGVNKPLGLLTQAATATLADDDTRPFGTMQKVQTGTAGAFDAANPADIFFDLEAEMHTRYRNNSMFVMARRTLSEVRKIKLTDGQYLWQPGIQRGVPGRILDYGYELDETMPALAANSLSIAFGDFKQAYTVLERPGTVVTLRDPYTAKPYVGFYTRKRVGGMLENTEALKWLEFA